MSEESIPGFDPKDFVKSLTSRPGVYRMLNAAGEVIYVGKALNLARRVGSYFSRQTSGKTQQMVSQIADIEITVTHTEGEALLLENTLIKELKPRYNILLRDDKGYPYIFISADEFPRLSYHRGAKRDPGRYFGPYPSATAVRETLAYLHKLFRLRQCEDSVFNNRSRPCLQYQIKRCSAPCVRKVSAEEYAEDIRHATMFLEGKDSQIIDELVRRMQAASEKLEFETAASYRDQIANLRRVQEKQYVAGAEGADVDIIVSVARNGIGCVQVFFIRGGHNLGNKTFFPQHTDNTDAPDVLAAFLPQYYLGREVPSEVLVNHQLEDHELLAQVLTEQAGHKVHIATNVRGERARWVKMAVTNAEEALLRRLMSQAGLMRRFEALQEALDLAEVPNRLECFDISHTMGEATVASCVVFDHNGPLKSDYRRFNIEGITPGDDYAAMSQAIRRRYSRLKKGEAKLPDLLLIDGGKGQLAAASAVIEELEISGVQLMGVAKGPARKPGQETLFLSAGDEAFILPPDSPALHLIQQIRDEAHRFAISGHRARRAKARSQSPLEEIPGIGAKRRRDLLNQFGGWQEVARAGVEDLAQVKGISPELAQRIYDVFHVEK